MANCILSYKDSLNNSKEFLKSIDAIDDSLYINNRELFEEAVDQLEEEALLSYKVSGKTWLIDPARPNYAIPNTAVLDQIDTKRKQLGIYDSQEAGSIGEETKTTPYKGAKDNTKEYLIQQGAIDQYNNILDLQKFRQINRKMSEQANSRYGISDKRLWLEDNDTKAVPNTEVLKQIDSVRKQQRLFDKQEFKYPSGNYSVDDTLIERFFRNNDVVSIKDMLQNISKQGHALSPLANHLLKYTKGYDNISLEVKPYDSNKEAAGIFNNKTKQIFIYKGAPVFKGDHTHVILHEILHALTWSKLRFEENAKIVSKFDQLRNVAKQTLGDNYFLSNNDEFITGLFTSSEFIKQLQGVSATNEQFKNLWEEILDYILRLFNVDKTNTSLYSQSVALASQIMEQGYQVEQSLEQETNETELSDFIRKETKLGKVTATDTTVLKRLLSSSSKLVFGTYYFDRSGDTDLFETSDKSTISYVTDSSLYSKINNRPIQEIFSIYGHTAMETKLGIMSSIVERLHSDNFNGKLFRYINSRVGGVEIRIVENTGKGMFVSDNNLYIDLQGVSNTIVNNNISDISEYLNTVLSEELIHLVVDSYITNEDYQNIYNETPKNIIDGIQQVYMFADPTVNIVVDEYLRMLIQDHFFGKTTELIKNQNVEITQPFLYQIFINTWEFIRDFFKKEYPRYTKQVVDKSIEMINESQGDTKDVFQLSTEDVLPNEITPELKSKLHEFASALGIEISVLDDLIERRGVNGIAQIRDFKILLQNGKESALGEEISHFLVRLLDNESDLKKRIMEEAPRTRLYKKLRQDPGYKQAYGDNTQLFKEEVAAKLISLYLSDKELFNHWAGSDQLIENLVRWIKDFFKWLRGNVKLNSFIEASQQILDLNTSNLVLSQAADAQEMYSIAEFINRTQKLESVNYDIKNVDKLLINISNTILDYEGYPGDKKEKRNFIFQAGENAERDKFYSTAKLTTLGLELKDKLEFLGDKEIVFYTRMYVSPALETRLMMEFGSNIRIERTNVEQPIFDADGNYITMSDETNTLQDIIDREVEKSPNVRLLAVDNSTISVKGAQARQYNQKTANYKPIKDGIKASYKAKEKLEINDKFKNELAQLNQGQLITKVEEAFKIINKEIQDINVLEGVLKKMGEEEVSKLFRDEYGNITLPKEPAQQALWFIKEKDKLEKGILQFVGTIESVTAFFSERNLTNYQTVRDLIEKANQTVDKKEQDRLYENAIQELALITKMGNSWREYISQFREIIQGYPKTETVQKLLSDLEGQIDQTKRIARELSKEAVSKYLAGKSFDAINLVNKELIAHYDKILQNPGLSKEKREEVELNKSRVKIKNHEDIISIFNGDIKDIDGTTVWIKHLHNSSDSLLGSVNVMIQKAYAEVEVETMQRAQDMGAKVREEMTKANVTQKDIEDNLVISEDFYMEELQPDGTRKWVKKSRLALLNPWQNLYVRFEKKLPMDEAYSKWSEAKKARLMSDTEIDALRKDYEAKRDTFNKWENQNWNKKYLKEFNERYDELLQDERNKELLEEVKKTQQEIYSDINENTLLLQSETDLNNVDHLNSLIEDGYRQLKKLKRDTYDDGSPKVDRDLEIAKLLQKKAEIDRPFYEYSSDTKRFRNDFKVFLSTLSEIPDDVYATMLSKLEGESFSELYEYAVQSAPHQVKIWLDLFTVVRYSPEWYAKRKVVVDQITEVSNQLADAYGKNKTDLGEIWSQLFTLTSPLRDEDNILDGADATPEVQSKVLEFEKEIESIKLLTRMEREGIYSPEIKKLKEELGKLIKDLNELQLSVTTDYYNQAFMEQAENTGFKDAFVAAYPSVPMSYQSNLLDVINTSQFRTFVNDNPDHPFVEWFKNNHLEKTSYNETGEASLTMVPTYIWYKKEPKDKKEILTLPSHKYSVRKVKEDFVTKKVDWDTWNPITKEFLPLKDNREFKNPAYTKLRTSSDSKNIGLRNILDEITKFHVSTQVNSIVQESKIGFALPSMAKQDLDNGFFKNIYNNFLDKQNRFEQGEGNYDETVEPESKKGFLNRVISWLNGWIDDKPDSNESETTKFQRIAVPYTHYMEPERVSKDILLSTTMFAASTGKADRMFKSLNTFKLIEEVLENPPKLDKKGRMTGVNSNRIKALAFSKEYHVYGVNKKYELGRGADQALNTIRKINTVGSLGFPFGFANTLKNNLQGRLQNLIGGRFADWSSPASMRKAAGNLNINFISWIAQSEVEPSKRTLDFHIINYMNPQLSGDIYQHLFSGAGTRIAKDRHIYLLNEGMEFSISVNLLYGHLYHVKVKNEKGEQKTLYDILEFKDGKIRPKEGWVTLKGERVVDDQYLLDTKLAYKTAAEYIQGKVVDKTALTQTTIGQALSYFKNWLLPMLRRRYDKKRENYMIGENLEGYWRTSLRLTLIMTRDFLRDGKLYWNTFTPEEKRNFITTAQEIGFMMVSLALLSLAFGFDADDPDKFKKLKDNSYAKNLALLIVLGAKNETESLSFMPFFNIEQQVVPPILTEGSKWVKNPTIGFAIIDNTWKTANYTYDLLAGSESAYYKQNMPQYGIEKGDTKAMHYLLKIAQIDDVINQVNPERKIQSMISMMKM